MSISLDDISKHLRSTETAADTLAALQQLIEAVGACSVARRAGPRLGRSRTRRYLRCAKQRGRQVTVCRGPPNPESRSQLAHRFTSGSQAPQLLLPFRAELVGLGRRQTPGPPRFA